MILYHGSNQKVDNIDLGKSRPSKDFGLAFYLSEDIEQAKEMAQFKVDTFGGELFINKFEFDIDKATRNDLKCLIFNAYTEEWARFVLSNRATSARVHDYDIVYGPIANDKVGLQIRKLKDGSIDKHEFLYRLQYMKGITYQYFFGTKTAVSYLKVL